MEDPTRNALGRPWAVFVCALLGLLAQAGCFTPYIGTTAASFMSKVQESRDPNIRFIAYSKLGSPSAYDDETQKHKAIKLLSKNLLSNREPVASRAVICRTLGELGKPDARPVLLKAIDDPETVVRAEACRALGKVGTPEDATVLARIMTADQVQDCRIAAIEGLGELKAKDWRVTGMLVAGMEHDSPAIRLASLQALRSITGKDLGVDPAPWREFVLKQAEKDRAESQAKAQSAARSKDKDKNTDRAQATPREPAPAADPRAADRARSRELYPR